MAKTASKLCILWIVVALIGTSFEAQSQDLDQPEVTTAATAETMTTPTEETGSTNPTDATSSTEPTDAPVTTSPDPCNPSPCLGGSTCVPFGDDFNCLCLPGELYTGSGCTSGKVFPGTLSLNTPYEPEMKDPTSEIYVKTVDTITGTIDKALGVSDNGYAGSTVVEIKEKAASKIRASTIEAIVDIFYSATSNINAGDIESAIKECTTCEGAGFTSSPSGLCDRKPCDETSMTCQSTSGFFDCSCKEGYIQSDFSDRLCVAGCPPGEKLVDDECQKCDFGYSGFECRDNWQLILVIVGTVLGALLLISIIALIVISVKSPKLKKRSKKDKDEDFVKPYVSHSSAKAPVGGNDATNDYQSSPKGPSGGGIPRIPRATTTNNWDNRSNMEMIPSNSRQNLISSSRNSRLNDDQDDMFSYSRPNNPYAQTQQNSGYNQNRAQFNPYAQNQGRSNPYYS